MALTGELSDLSLAELIEFFCNQRRTGRLKVIYPVGPGYFYLQAGSVVHARIGELRGIEAVYYALTLPNASFTFSPAFEAPEHTINQPWASVALEGLRRMDEGIQPRIAFPDEPHSPREEVKSTGAAPSPIIHADQFHAESQEAEDSQKTEKVLLDLPGGPFKDVPAFLAQTENQSRWSSRSWSPLTVIGAIALLVALIGVPWGWYARSKAAKFASQAKASSVENPQPAPSSAAVEETAAPSPPPYETNDLATNDAAALAERRQREAHAKEKTKVQEPVTAVETSVPKATPAPNSSSGAKNQSPPAPGARKVTVQVTYDEKGRVTQASGGDANALRIARQKRFPPGKAGTATITIPIN